MRKLKVGIVLTLTAVLLLGCANSEDGGKQQQILKEEGMALQAAGDYEGALKKYEEALGLANMKVGEAELDLACYKASAQAGSGDLSGAIDTYSAVLALQKSDEGSLYLGRGLLYTRQGNLEEAEKDLNQAMKETGDPMTKGIIYQVVGQSAKAKECFEKAKESGNAEALFFLSKIYEDAGDHEYAMSLLGEYVSAEDAGAEGCLTAAEYYMQDGKYEDALQALQKGISKGESLVKKMLLQEEIACYEHLGDFAGAREKAESYLEIYPEDALIQKEYEFLKSR